MRFKIVERSSKFCNLSLFIIIIQAIILHPKSWLNNFKSYLKGKWSRKLTFNIETIFLLLKGNILKKFEILPRG